MRGLPQPEPRRDVAVPIVVALLAAAASDVTQAHQLPVTDRTVRVLHHAEQVQLLLRLAADTGARRGELGALRLDDLDGWQLRIERGVSAEVVSTTKTGRARTVTVGAARLWQDNVAAWSNRPASDGAVGPWLVSHRPDHTVRMPCSELAGLFWDFARRHEHGDVTLHRLRHTVATILIAEGPPAPGPAAAWP